MSEDDLPRAERPSLAYIAGVVVRALVKLPGVLRDAAVEGWEEAANRTAARSGAEPAPAPGRSGPVTQPVMLSSRTMLVVERAQQLAADAREDPGAVDDLVSVSESDPSTLREAAVWFQESAWNEESRQADRAYRLLTAAIRGDAVRRVGDEVEVRFVRLDQLQASSPGEAWAALCTLEPTLRSVADEARAGRLGRAVRLPAVGHDGEGGGEAGTEWLAAEARIRDRLQPLVGPSAGSEDWLVRTAVAYRIAADHVRGLRPA